MHRGALVCVIACSLAAACGGSPPTSPSRSDGPSNVLILGVTQPPASVFGSGTPDLAGCLAAPGLAACFTASRAAALSIGSAATAPGSPGTLSATVTGSSVTLVWSAPTSGDPVVGYVLEAGSGSGSADLANLLTNSTATTFSTSGVPSGTYYVRIKAQSGGGVGPSSNEIIVVVGSTGCTSSPGGPGTLGSSVNGSTVVLSWTAPAGAPTTYIVEAGSSPGSSNLAVIDLGGPSTTFTAANVAAGTYYVRMRARNACGTGAASNELTLVVGSAPTGGPNRSPTFPNPLRTSLDTQSQYNSFGQLTGGISTISILTPATDPDGDALSYAWTGQWMEAGPFNVHDIAPGDLQGNGLTAVWMRRSSWGMLVSAKITVTASDGRGGSAKVTFCLGSYWRC